MINQLHLDFNIHHRENNAESELRLQEHTPHFSKQCIKLYEILRSGRKLTVLEAYSEGIASLPRRVLDLKEGGVRIEKEKVPNTRYYRYYMP